jgi:hypothetical protein
MSSDNRMIAEHICATCWREDNKKSFHPECSENCPFQGN